MEASADGREIALVVEDEGAAYPLVIDPIVATLEKILDARGGGGGYANDQFGDAVAIDGDRAVVGAWLEDFAGIDGGAAYIFSRSGSTWDEVASIGGEAGEKCGYSVAISGDKAVLGCPGANGNTGRVSIYDPDLGSRNITPPSGVLHAGDFLGASVAVRNDKVVVGAPRYDSGGLTDNGAAFVGAPGDLFGVSVGISGDAVIVGAQHAAASDGTADTGAAYVYRLDSIGLASSNLTVAENAGFARVTVTRTGNIAQAATVDYITNDDQRLFNCNPSTEGDPSGLGAIRGVATARCDYSTTVGTLSFAAGETNKTFDVPLTDDVHVEGTETFPISLRNATNAALAGGRSVASISITDNDVAGESNPIAGNPFFIRQHYLDFFGRNPVQSEIDGWVRVTGADCPLDAPDNCYDRVWVSGKGFFESVEFQQKGYFVYRFYKLLGQSRLPKYNEFIPDMVSLAGTGDADKNAFAQRFMTRADYLALYPASLTNDQFVDKLVQQTGLTTLNAAQMKADLNSNAKTRQQVLREVVESAEMNGREYTNAWVVMQYFGYLRRDGAASEYNGLEELSGCLQRFGQP